MAAKTQPWMVVLLVFISAVPQCLCQSNSPQNIQTFYPFPIPIPIPPPPPPPPQRLPPLLLPPSPPQRQQGKSSSKGTVVKAVVATAASTLVLSGLFFLLLQRYSRRKNENGKNTTSNPYGRGNDPIVARDEFPRFDGNLKGVIVDEDGLDVLYWRNLQRGKSRKSFGKEVFNDNSKQEEKQMTSRGDRRDKSEMLVQEIPLLRGKSSTSHQVFPEEEDAVAAGEKQGLSIKPTTGFPPPPPPPPPPPLAPILAIPNTRSPAPPPPPPPPLASVSAIPNRKSPAPPPPPPIPAKKGPAPPPPPPKTPGLASSSKPSPPPPRPKGISSGNTQSESLSRESSSGDGNGQVKLKPLHWDKVNPNVDHSMVWHKIDGSFRFDDDLMEALFGSVATNRKSPKSNSNSTSPKSERSNPSSQVFILDARKSQNTAIVLRAISVSRNEIIDSLIEGQGLNGDTLEKLTKIAPTKEEESEILAFDGDPARLALAESFLYHLLRAVPSAFTRFNAMLFRSNYDSEILHLKETLQTLDLACKELRTRGLFLKLLEAILKAGNRMNAGTSRGNAQAFSLTALRKLSDVKSTDRKTTLLHFVVEEVVRAEGKRCVINRNRSLSRSSSRSSNDSTRNSDNSTSNDDREREYTMLGLPVVGGLSSEFSNVKKAATIDYDANAKTCSVLTARVSEIRQILTQCGNIEEGFVKEMKNFLEIAEEELKAVREEQTRVMELVKRTTEYYQAGASKDKEKHPLQLFVIVKDFLGMVDQACIDIAGNLQKRKTTTTNVGSSSSPKSAARRNAVRFPQLPENFMSDKSKSSSSESEDDDF